MADKITETDVVQIQAQDSDNNKYSFNVENPKTGTTISDVREAFQPLINSGKWISKQGYPFSYIPQATVTKTKKIQLDDGTGTVTVTPSEINMDGQTQDVTFTVTGAPIKGYELKNRTEQEGGGTARITFTNPVINETLNTFTVNIQAYGKNAKHIDTIINIVTINAKLTIPVHNYT